MGYRTRIEDFIRQQAQPPDKYAHQPRVYALARKLAEDLEYDDDVLHAAAWLHDLGVFVGHRQSQPADLASWDNVAYAVDKIPQLLMQFGFPGRKVNAVALAIKTHLPSSETASPEGALLRDADILEQLGAIGIMRVVSKVGRDTRYPTHWHALYALQNALDTLPDQLRLPAARRLAKPRIEALRHFMRALESEREGIEL